MPFSGPTKLNNWSLGQKYDDDDDDDDDDGFVTRRSHSGTDCRQIST
jgi:hypothetical protein